MLVLVEKGQGRAFGGLQASLRDGRMHLDGDAVAS